MPSWIVPSDTEIPSNTGHTTDHNHIADDLTLVNTALPVVSGGLTGATQATRFAGATLTGAPASGTFAAGDFIIDRTGKVWICTAAGSPGTWASVSGGGGSAAVDWLNVVTTYGADPTGVADSTTAIQNALTAAGSAGGKTVYCPAGTFLTGSLTIPQNVTIRGDGMGATTLKLKSTVAQYGNMLTNQQLVGTSYDADLCQVRDMTLDGNSGAMTAGWWNCGIVLSNRSPTGAYEYVDARHQVSNVLIQNFTGDGFVQYGRGDIQVSDVQVWVCGGFGFNLTEDSYYVNCDAGACGLDGFIVSGGSNRFTNCKAWFSGAALTSTRGTGASALSKTTPSTNAWDGGGITGGITFSLANGYGNGWLFQDITGSSVAGNHSANTLSACGAQDNARAGFYVNGGRQVLVGCEADSNNNCGVTTGTTGLGSYAGFQVDADRTVLSGIAWDRAANTNRQAAALYLLSGDPGNLIQLTFFGALNDGSNMPPLHASSTGNPQGSVCFNGMGDGSMQFPSYAASYTPDPFLGVVVSMTLTGAITVNAPALTGTNTTGTFLVPGQKLILMFTQDATGGRTVTLDAVFRLNGKSFSTTANATTSLTFIWDGTNWQAQG